jgi:L-ascorbate metabolism protein UlaG (beta-lactamase superfamily)
MKIQFIRHATFVLTVNNKKIVVDPMLSNPGALPPIPLTPNRVRNPLIPLPVDVNELISGADAVLLTHYHFDHFDSAAEKLLPKDILIFCQPGDDKKLNDKGFANLRVINEVVEWKTLSIRRFPANHGKGFLLGKILKKSSSYFIQAGDESLFITGDALLDQLLISSLRETKPEHIIANTGAAKFLFGEPITLTADALLQIKHILPKAKILAVHMDAINHCQLSKDALQKYLIENKVMADITVPNEGDCISFK